MTVIRAVLAVLMIGGAVALAALAPVQNGGQAAVKLEAARQVELVDGDLNKAIGLYLEIVKGFPLEREVAAKALLHMGQSYEKIGKKDNAREAYSQILARYGSQTRIAVAARSALARFADNGPDSEAATAASLES